MSLLSWRPLQALHTSLVCVPGLSHIRGNCSASGYATYLYWIRHWPKSVSEHWPILRQYGILIHCLIFSTWPSMDRRRTSQVIKLNRNFILIIVVMLADYFVMDGIAEEVAWYSLFLLTCLVLGSERCYLSEYKTKSKLLLTIQFNSVFFYITKTTSIK